jgi:hypothetical protein
MLGQMAGPDLWKPRSMGLGPKILYNISFDNLLEHLSERYYNYNYQRLFACLFLIRYTDQENLPGEDMHRAGKEVGLSLNQSMHFTIIID